MASEPAFRLADMACGPGVLVGGPLPTGRRTPTTCNTGGLASGHRRLVGQIVVFLGLLVRVALHVGVLAGNKHSERSVGEAAVSAVTPGNCRPAYAKSSVRKKPSRTSWPAG